jgi:hypothetical protein
MGFLSCRTEYDSYQEFRKKEQLRESYIILSLLLPASISETWNDEAIARAPPIQNPTIPT